MKEPKNTNPETSGADNEIDVLRKRVAELEQERLRAAHVERALQLSEERYRTLVETMNEGVALQDERGIIVYANDTFCRMLGYSRQEVLGHASDEFVEPEERDLFQRQMKVRTKDERWSGELTFRRKDETRLITLASPAPVIDSAGEYRGGFAVFTDITAMKQTEEQLAHERNLLRTLMDSVPDYVYVKDTQSRFISTNVPHLRVLGAASLDEVIGKTDFDFFPRELASEYFADEQVVLRTGRPLMNKVEEVVDSDGKHIWSMTFKAPLRDNTGNIIGLVGISRDFTELRLAERALRDSEDRFRLILENSRDIAYKFDLVNRRYDYVSPSAQDLLGLSSQEIAELGFEGYLDRVHPEDRQRCAAHRQSLMIQSPDGPAPALVEYRFKHKSGVFRWVGEITTAVWANDGQPIALVGTIRDITASKEAEQAVRAASRMDATATLAGGIAHQLNNLMVGVLGNAELVKMRIGGDPKVNDMLNTVIQSAQEAGELAHQMLAFARGGKYEPRVLNFNDTVHETLRMEKGSISPYVSIDLNLEPGLWSVIADPVQMSHIVTNLSLNAAEAIEGAGRIRIATQNVEVTENAPAPFPELPVGRYVCLRIEDTGRGMAPDVIAHLFEPFFTTKFQGRGLGLAAVYGIVKNHDGHIFVESHVGRGSVFHVYLPATEQVAPRAEGTSTEGLATGTETVLVVDDEPMVLNVSQTLLERLGYNVLTAQNGQEAVDLVASYPGRIDVVLLDMAMPVLSGAQTFPLLVAARPNLRIIICSGFEIEPATRAMLDSGATGFIRKPFSVRLLAAEIRKAIDG